MREADHRAKVAGLLGSARHSASARCKPASEPIPLVRMMRISIGSPCVRVRWSGRLTLPRSITLPRLAVALIICKAELADAATCKATSSAPGIPRTIADFQTSIRMLQRRPSKLPFAYLRLPCRIRREPKQPSTCLTTARDVFRQGKYICHVDTVHYSGVPTNVCKISATSSSRSAQLFSSSRPLIRMRNRPSTARKATRAARASGPSPDSRANAP